MRGKLASMVWGLLGVLALVPAVRAEDKPVAPPPVSVMVLGAYHFGNPGLDVVNAKVDDVTTPRRQQELEALSPMQC